MEADQGVWPEQYPTTAVPQSRREHFSSFIGSPVVKKKDDTTVTKTTILDNAGQLAGHVNDDKNEARA